ncbi:MAG TPA: hypothetical protein VII06_17095 [Chloroflexota bacterium]
MQIAVSIAAQSTVVDRLAHGLSALGNPFALAVLVILQLAAHSSAHPRLVSSILLGLLLFALLPALFVYAAYRSGRVRDLDVTHRSERLAPTLVAVLCACAGWLGLTQSGAPTAFVWAASGLALQLAVLALLTWRFKVSFHAASAADLVVTAALLGSPPLATLSVGAALLIGWARCHLGRHRVREVAVGYATAGLLLLTAAGAG